MAPLLSDICQLGDFEFESMFIKYYDKENDLVLVGKYPIPEDSFVAKSDIEAGKALRIIVS